MADHADPTLSNLPIARSPAVDRRQWRDWAIVWAIVLTPALILRTIILLSGLTVSFNSDEAIVALMARHINQGQPIPIFFYGQPYLGSLDAILVSLGFRIFGESVPTIRLVESGLYLLIVITTVLLAARLSRDRADQRRVATIAGLLVAIPPVMFTLYTTMTLGGYGETLLFGNLLWLIGWDLVDRPDGPDRAGGRSIALRWIALGVVAGLGWWTDALILVYATPIGLFLLVTLIKRRHPHRIGQAIGWVALAGIAFIVGSAPWWIDNLRHQWEALHWLLDNSQAQGFGRIFGVQTRLIGLVFLDYPAALGVRYSWSPDWWSGTVGLLIVGLAVVAVTTALYKAIRLFSPERFVLISLLILSIVTVASSSGVDSSGRYFLPAIVMFALLFGFTVDPMLRSIRRANIRRILAAGIVVTLLVFQAIGHLVALRTVPPGLTSQFAPITDFTNSADDQVIAFLAAHGGSVGYGTYWVTFRLAFLSHEQIVLDAWLPYKDTGSYTPADRRYAPYTRLVESAADPVYVTANTPGLNAELRQAFITLGVQFSEQAIGPYQIFYGLSRRVSPDQLGLGLPGA